MREAVENRAQVFHQSATLKGWRRRARDFLQISTHYLNFKNDMEITTFLHAQQEITCWSSDLVKQKIVVWRSNSGPPHESRHQTCPSLAKEVYHPEGIPLRFES